MERAAPFHFRHLLLPVALGLILLWAADVARLDARVSSLFFDPATRQFPLRNDRFLELGLHLGVKYAVVVFAVLVAIATIVTWVGNRWIAYRQLLAFLILAMALSSGSVSWLKRETGRHCPYDLQIYGGAMPYYGLFESRPDAVPPGRCWPSGHASTGFSLFGLYFVARWRARRRLGSWLLGGSFALGSVLGLGRVAQGAHFVSHVLWSALVCWLVTLALYELMLRRRAPPQLA